MKMRNAASRTQVEGLVGPLDEEMLGAIDFYVTDRVGIFIPAVTYCGHESTPDHAHAAWNFFIHFNRHQVLENFETVWADEGYTVTAVPPRAVHTDKPHELNTRYASIFVDSDYFGRIAAQYGNGFVEPDSPFCFAVDNGILNAIKEFIAEYESDLPGCDGLLEASALRIAHALFRGMQGVETGWRAVTDRIEIHEACDFIHRFYYKKLKVSDIAKFVAVSESHFTRIFRKETGRSPLDYVNMIRIDRAKKLLRGTDKQITGIALEVGFSSPSHFSTAFAAHAGMTPAEFRQRGL